MLQSHKSHMRRRAPRRTLFAHDRIPTNLFRSMLAEEWDEAFGALKAYERAERARMVGREVVRWLLVLAFLGGTLTVAAVAPNVFGASAKLRRQFFRDPELPTRIRYLAAQRYITAERANGGYRISLRPRGLARLAAIFFKRRRIDRTSNVPDGTLRLVIFDLPRRKNAERNALRESLRTMGLEQLQESVFLARRPCEAEVRTLAGAFSISSYVDIVYATAIERLDAEHSNPPRS